MLSRKIHSLIKNVSIYIVLGTGLRVNLVPAFQEFWKINEKNTLNETMQSDKSDRSYTRRITEKIKEWFLCLRDSGRLHRRVGIWGNSSRMHKKFTRCLKESSWNLSEND